MKNLKFRTSAKCAGCTAKIDGELAKILPAGSWSFDLSSPDKTLTVTGSPVEAAKIAQAVQAAGYRAEEMPA